VTQEFLHHFDVLSIRLKKRRVSPPERVPRDSLADTQPFDPALIEIPSSSRTHRPDGRPFTVWEQSVNGLRALYHQGTLVSSEEDDVVPASPQTYQHTPRRP